MSRESRHLERHAELDRQLVAAVKGIRLLGSVSWPASVQTAFLERWRKGIVSMPVVDYVRPDLANVRGTIMAIHDAADAQHPVGDYIRRSAESWRVATELLDALGKPELTTHSIRLFGRPGSRVPGSELSNLDAARHFISLANELDSEVLSSEADYCIPADVLREDLQQQLDAFFGDGTVRVEVDDQLIAKAAAGATRIRLRSATCFSEYDRNQLLEHEAYVHTLTALNGRRQPRLASLALSSPRITATQEGLAVFAELMTGSLDIERIKRISLRIHHLRALPSHVPEPRVANPGVATFYAASSSACRYSFAITSAWRSLYQESPIGRPIRCVGIASYAYPSVPCFTFTPTLSSSARSLSDTS